MKTYRGCLIAVFITVVSTGCESLPVIEQLAGVPFSTPPVNPIPLFRHKDIFIEGEDLWVALDPGLWSSRVGQSFAIHVVEHKRSWRDGDILHDIIPPRTVTLRTGTLDDNYFFVWRDMALASAPHLFEQAYDVVLDFDENGHYDEWDIIDRNGVLERSGAKPFGGFTLAKDPGIPGDFLVSGHQYDMGSMTLSSGLNVNLVGKVFYPATSTAANSPVSPDLATYPLVVIAHGLDVPANPTSYLGFEYLASHLASRGFIAATVALHELEALHHNNVQRAEFYGEHVTAIGSRSTDDPIILQLRDRLETDNIGLVGHSKSGLAVVNVQRSMSAIKAVVGLAPAAGNHGNPTNTSPLLIMHGTRDGNIYYGQPYRLYDVAKRPKHFINIVGANHTQFSTVPNSDYPLLIPVTLSADYQRALTKAYVTAFLASYLKGVQAYSELFDFYRAPPSVYSVRQNLVFSYQPKSGIGEVIDNAQDAPGSATTNSLHLANHPAHLTVFVQESLRKQISPCNFYVQDSDGIRLAWDRGHTSSITFDIGDRDIRGFEFLNIRVGQRFRTTANPNPVGRSQRFNVILSDTEGHRSYPIRSELYGEIRYPDDIGDGGTLCNGTKSVLQTIRIPVRVFSANNSPLNQHHVASVTFEFHPVSSGELIFDDIEFIGLDLTIFSGAGF